MPLTTPPEHDVLPRFPQPRSLPAAPPSRGERCRVSEIRTEPHGALIGSHRLPLSPTEAKLLQLIIAAGTTPVSRSRIEKQLYGSDGRRSNAIEVAICRLRGKLAPHHYCIHATRGQGYTIAPSTTS